MTRITAFVAKDGTVFKDETSCAKYEERVDDANLANYHGCMRRLRLMRRSVSNRQLRVIQCKKRYWTCRKENPEGLKGSARFAKLATYACEYAASKEALRQEIVNLRRIKFEMATKGAMLGYSRAALYVKKHEGRVRG